MRWAIPPSSWDTYHRLHFRRGGGDSSRGNPRCVPGRSQDPRGTAGRLLRLQRWPPHGTSRRHLGPCERSSRDAPTSRLAARRSAGLPRGAHHHESTRLFHVQHWSPGMCVLESKIVRSLELTMGDSQGQQQDGRGDDGENEDHRGDRQDDGGVIDTCLGVVVIVRHGGLECTPSVWYAFKRLLAGRSLRQRERKVVGTSPGDEVCRVERSGCGAERGDAFQH